MIAHPQTAEIGLIDKIFSALKSQKFSELQTRPAIIAHLRANFPQFGRVKVGLIREHLKIYLSLAKKKVQQALELSH